MVYKLYLIEIIGSFPILFGLFSAIIIILILYLIADNDSYMLGIYDRSQKIKTRKKLKRRIIILLSSLLICLSIATLTPSKLFMYSVTGINETINFIEGNEEVKEISSKTLKIINNKLDKYLKEDNETN